MSGGRFLEKEVQGGLEFQNTLNRNTYRVVKDLTEFMNLGVNSP